MGGPTPRRWAGRPAGRKGRRSEPTPCPLALDPGAVSPPPLRMASLSASCVQVLGQSRERGSVAAPWSGLPVGRAQAQRGQVRQTRMCRDTPRSVSEELMSERLKSAAPLRSWGLGGSHLPALGLFQDRAVQE